MTPDPALAVLLALEEAARYAAPAEGLEGRDRAENTLLRLADLLSGKLIPEAAARRPLIVLTSGGTNAGKSSVVNLLAGQELSAISALARATRRPLAIGAEADLRSSGAGPHGWPVRPSAGPGSALSEAAVPREILTAPCVGLPPGLVVVDSPDLDSDHEPNRIWADHLLILADAVIFVVTPEKYHDAAGLRFLEQARRSGRTVLGIFNKDTGEPEALEEFRDRVLQPGEHLARLPRLPGGPVPGGAEAEALRSALARTLGDPEEIKGRALRGTLAEALEHARLAVVRAEMEIGIRRELEGWVEGVVAEAGVQFRRFLRSSSRFPELDRLVAKVLLRFEVPVLDPLYRKVVRWPQRMAGAAWQRIRGPREDPLDQAAERERREIRMLAEELSRTLRQGSVELPVEVQAAYPGWAEEVPLGLPEERLQAYELTNESRVEAWLDEEEERLFARLAEHPHLIQGLRVSLLTLQVGTGAAAAWLTGGLGPTDVLLVPAVERLLSRITRALGGGVYFRRLQRDLLWLHQDLLEEVLRKALAEPLLGRCPAPDPGLAERLKEAARGLESVRRRWK